MTEEVLPQYEFAESDRKNETLCCTSPAPFGGTLEIIVRLPLAIDYFHSLRGAPPQRGGLWLYINLQLYHKICIPGESPGIGLLLAEGLAVGALVHGGVHLVGTHQDLVQGAVVLTLAVMGTLLDGTLDRLVCIAVHNEILLEIRFTDSMNPTVAIYTFL